MQTSRQEIGCEPERIEMSVSLSKGGIGSSARAGSQREQAAQQLPLLSLTHDHCKFIMGGPEGPL
jgi:hypothetical protein